MLFRSDSKMAKKTDAEKAAQKDDGSKPEKSENVDDENPTFSDPEEFVDDISDEELLGDILKQSPKETDGVESVIVVDGIPQISPDRFDKLRNVVSKIFSKVGEIVNEAYPKTPEGHTKGYVFIEYANPAHAAEAVTLLNNHKLDRQHTFTVNLFTDFKKYEDIPDEWEPPAPLPYEDLGNLHYYLLEPDSYDQFSTVVNRGSLVQIWLNAAPEPVKLVEKERWTETFVKWSPLGTYFTTIHHAGVALWGGPDFSRKMKFAHPGVQFIDFSPSEKYVVTYSPQFEGQGEPKNLIIWDIRTGLEKRSFFLNSQMMWPFIRWSHDDKYFARSDEDMLSVYETPSFGLLNKKSFKIPGIRDFSWSPADNILAYWMAEDKDVPARVTLIEIPSRNEIRSKNLFNVADCRMHWQKSGDYLCVKVDRYSKIRKDKNEIKYSGMYYNFEIFHMQEKQIPVDSVEVKESIHAFAWEPVGSKFAIIHGDQPNICVSFYGVKTGQTPALLKKLEKKCCNHLFWSPAGQFIVLADLRSSNGMLEFVDANDFNVMAQQEHYQASDVEWDPTGRYVVTVCSFWKTKVDTGYCVWSFQGKILKRNTSGAFCQLLWRPRPPSLLSAKEQKEIRKNLKKYSAQFESKDRMRTSRASKELIEKRRTMMNEFNAYREKCREKWAEQKLQRLVLRNNVDTDEIDNESKNEDEEVVEFFVKEEITVID